MENKKKQMFVYSSRIIQFTQNVKKMVYEILSQEIGVKTSRSRFFDKEMRFSYPISVVIYNDRSMLGYFDPNFYELGFHEKLMHQSLDLLRNVIRHELAHYFTWIRYPNPRAAHGSEFRSFCKEVGWGQEVYQACMHIEPKQKNESNILRKVQKVMALASSSNPHEAEAAMIKSQQLLLKHHIDATDIAEEKMYVKRILEQRQRTSKLSAIAHILESFFVSVIFSRGQKGVCLEILGDETNIEIAEYVAEILNHKLDELWEQTRLQYKLKGKTAKNSFFQGVSKGYRTKVDTLQHSYSEAMTQALTVLDQKLQQAKAMVYPHLTISKSKSGYCKQSSLLGERMGKQLDIQGGIVQRSFTEQLLSYFK